MAEVNVIMLGGKRVGKSTILAAIMSTLGRQGVLSSHFICDDKTDYGAFNKFSIKEKYERLQSLIKTNASCSMFMTRGMGDSKIQKYDISIRLSDKPGQLMMGFYDVPGEFTNPQKLEFKSEMLPLIGGCDVFIIAIDTPYLMECSRVVNNAHNRVTDLEVALQNIIVKDKNDLKMVMFVPLKCEKWMKEGKINQVIDKVKDSYENLLKSLSAYPSMLVSILPIATIGGIYYKQMETACVVKRDGISTGYSCSPINNRSVTLANGTSYPIQEPYSVDADPEAKVDGVSIPNAWYTADAIVGFTPHNCEQVALHILRFLIGKTILKQNEQEKDNKTFLGYISNAINNLVNWWKGLDFNAFKKLVKELQDAGKVKDSGEGIELIHVCPEWKEVDL